MHGVITIFFISKYHEDHPAQENGDIPLKTSRFQFWKESSNLPFSQEEPYIDIDGFSSRVQGSQKWLDIKFTKRVFNQQWIVHSGCKWNIHGTTMNVWFLRCDMSQVKLVSSTSSNTQFISPFSPVMFLTSVPSLGKAAFKADKSSEAQVHPVPHLKRLLIGHKHWSTPKKRAGMVVFGGSIAVQHL